MSKTTSSGGEIKVYYPVVEAAILWADAVDHAQQILKLTAGRGLTESIARLKRWPDVRLCAARIYDALVHLELPYGRSGITTDDPSLLDDPALTIRHVDLKEWMSHCYPGDRPEFLFDEIERGLHPGISVRVAQTLMMEREALRLRLSDCVQVRERLGTQIAKLDRERRRAGSETPGARAEGTYLNIVGGLLDLLLGESPGGVAYSSFDTLDAIVSALLAHHGGKPGISERTLWAKFSTAKRHLEAQ